MIQHVLRVIFLFSLCLGPTWTARAQDPVSVDLELVLAVDVSLSMDLDEQRLQRSGYVGAFRDPQIWDAIRTGGTGRIAVIYIEWAGPSSQSTVLPWTLIDTEKAAQDFADVLEAKPISRARLTSISGALLYASRELRTNPFRGTRQVIDVSGDGPNNSGAPIIPVRDEIVASGIIINGLPILLKRGGFANTFDIPNLDEYYAECVIGGQGSFSIPIRDKSEFSVAIRRKLILEIAGLSAPSEPRLIRTQASPGKSADCQVGEKLWRQYMDDRYIRE
jgi:hypothetical protein